MLVELLDVSDVAALLDEPEHVVGVACARFATFVPMVRIGRDRWYPPEAIPVLRVIFDQIRVGVPDEHIETVLTKRFPVTRISSQDLAGQIEQPLRQAEADVQTEQVRDVFDRYQSAIQNEMLHMRQEIAQMAPTAAPPLPPRPELSLSELARREGASQYLDPRQYGFSHVADVPRQANAAPRPTPRRDEDAERDSNRDAAPKGEYQNGLSEDAKVVLTAISRQAAASETAVLRNDIEVMRDELGLLMEQFKSFSQQLGVYQHERERPRVAATGTHGPAAAHTKLEVVGNERDNDQFSHLQNELNGSGLLSQLTKRSPRRMGKTLLGNEEP